MLLSVVFIGCLVFFANAHDKKDEEYLAKFGYYNPYSFNGGSEFKDAVKSYQKFFGLKETGVIDAETRKEMDKPRCGMSDAKPNENAYYRTGSKWRRTSLTYRFLAKTQDLDHSKVQSTIQRAFSMWSAVTPLRFSETFGSSSDFTIGFYRRSHGDNSPFDGRGRVLAHAYFPSNGRIHFDEDETWGINGRGTDLLWVAVHEIGHAIGLHHSNVRGTIMWPSYSGYKPNISLHDDDITGIQSLYGSGGGTVPTKAPPTCSDQNRRCPGWTRYCRSNSYVIRYCRKTCRRC